jgi:sterol desaturase/sphingolipid hydroxylase (fatty acid hydroxylase superfamily)
VSVLDVLLATGASLVFLAAVFVPLERAFPARRGQRLVREGSATDLAFFLGQYLLWNGVVLSLLRPLAAAVAAAEPRGLPAAFASQPFALQVVEVVLASDLLVYWGHRLQHRVPFLWRFHAVHHSAERLDWLAAHREHPLDSVYTLTLINLPAIVAGFPVATLAGLVAFRGVWAIFIHSNVRVPLGPLRALVGSPELHHWHHARDRRAGNYANLSPLMDLAFGTYRYEPVEPESLGLVEPFPRTYLGQLVRPLLPKRSAGAPPPAAPVPTPTRASRALLATDSRAA